MLPNGTGKLMDKLLERILGIACLLIGGKKTPLHVHFCFKS